MTIAALEPARRLWVMRSSARTQRINEHFNDLASHVITDRSSTAARVRRVIRTHARTQ